MDLIGQQIGDWRIDKMLGEGGMSVVYLGHHVWLGAPGAVKVLHPALNQQTQQLKRFQREAHTASQLEHDNIIQIRDFSHDKRHGFFMVLEYLEGQDLDEIMLHAPLPKRWILGIIKQVCEGLQAIHEAGIIHRDLKPSNIFLLPNKPFPHVKILDFGIAKTLHLDHNDKLTKTNSILGTPAYLAPEQVRSGNPITPETDIYALGSILYEMFAGCLPFQAPNLIEHMLMLLQEPPPPLGAHRLLLRGSALEACIAKMLSKNPADRPATVREAWAALEEAAESFLDPLDDGPEDNPNLTIQEGGRDHVAEHDTDESDESGAPRETANYTEQLSADDLVGSGPPSTLNAPNTLVIPGNTHSPPKSGDAGPTTEAAAFVPMGESRPFLPTPAPLPPLELPDTMLSPHPAHSPMDSLGPPESLDPLDSLEQKAPASQASQLKNKTPRPPLPTTDAPAATRPQPAMPAPSSPTPETQWWPWWVVFALAVSSILAVAFIFRGAPPPAKKQAAPLQDARYKALWQVGQRAFKRREFKRAVQSWRRAIQLDSWRKSPQYPHLYRSIGGALKAQGKYYTSLAFYRRYLQSIGNQDKLAAAMVKKLLPPLEEAINTRTKDAQKLLRELNAQLQKSAWVNAFRLYRRILVVAPSIPQIHIALSKLLTPFPRFAQAQAKHAIKDFALTPEERATLVQQIKHLQAKSTILGDQRKQLLAESRKLLLTNKGKRARSLLETGLGHPSQMTLAATHKAIRALLKWTIQQGKYREAQKLLALYQRLLRRFVSQALYDWMSGEKSIPTKETTVTQARVLAHLQSAQQGLYRFHKALRRGLWKKAGSVMRRAQKRWKQAKAQDTWQWTATALPELSHPRAESWPKALAQLDQRWSIAKRLVQQARLTQAIREHQRISRMLPPLPSVRKWKRRCRNTIRKLRRTKAALQRAKLLLQQKNWRAAEAIFAQYKRKHPKAWNRAAIKEYIHLCRCGYGGVSWKLCKTQTFKPKSRTP